MMPSFFNAVAGRGPALPILLVLMSALPARAEEWILTFAAREEKIVANPKDDPPQKTEIRSYTQTVVLGAGYLVLQDDRQKSIFDFKGKRIRSVNLADKTSNNCSLFHLPSFFEHELINRAMLGAAMRSAKIDPAAGFFDRFDDESSLHVSLPAGTPFALPVPGIETVQQDGGTEFRHAGRTAVRFVPASAVLPAAWHHRFLNYLAYGCSLHPEIRHRIAETGTIPRELVITSHYLNTSTTSSLRLISSAAAATDSSGLPADARPAVHPDDPFHAILAGVSAAADSPDRPDPAETIKFADQAVEAGRPLDAVLALLEYGLQSGAQLMEAMRQHKDVFGRDPACQAYFSAFGQSDKAAAEKSLAINARIDRRGLAKAHMLDLQRANLLIAAGQPREALAAFLTVLRANPYHAGALHDLGGLFLRSYEHGKAWLCWDAARRLYPSHPMMRDVTRMEMELVRNQPDFF